MTPKPRFLSPLVLTDIDGETMTLYTSLKFYSGDLKRVVLVPAGFQTDFASIPRFFTRLLPKNGLYDKAAVLHDAAYRGQLFDSATKTRMHLTREQADELFREGMRFNDLPIPAWKIATMYHTLRMFGGPAYHG